MAPSRACCRFVLFSVAYVCGVCVALPGCGAVEQPQSGTANSPAKTQSTDDKVNPPKIVIEKPVSHAKVDLTPSKKASKSGKARIEISGYVDTSAGAWEPAKSSCLLNVSTDKGQKKQVLGAGVELKATDRPGRYSFSYQNDAFTSAGKHYLRVTVYRQMESLHPETCDSELREFEIAVP